jgi:hypothetical protein
MNKFGLKGWPWVWALLIGVMPACGDELVLLNGTSVRGTFTGFSEHKFLFKTSDRGDCAEFASNVQSIRLERPTFVSAQFLTKRFDNVEFKGYGEFRVRLLRGIDEMAEPVTMLKGMQIFERGPAEIAGDRLRETQPPAMDRMPPHEPVANGLRPNVGISEQEARERDWKRTGRWREEPAPAVGVISRGEDIDIDRALDKNMVNVVHFHLSSSLASVRQGGYLSSLAAKRESRFVVKRIEIPDWKVPICRARDLRSLPQFWFYSRSGRLVTKLANRFTDSDIEAALEQAMQTN